MSEPELGFTLHDSPGVVARIRRDLDRIVQRVRAADPHLRALVLTGGFARGEGTVLDGAPQNDYDLVALRGVGRPREPYARVRAGLESELGLHVDLAPVPAWRLRWVSPSIFWYETALRGRTLWGERLLSRIRVRDPTGLTPTEGMRLLANRAAGLLLVTAHEPDDGAHAYRIQAAKGLLAALDVHLLAAGVFPPSQRERWAAFCHMRRSGALRGVRATDDQDFGWAFTFKVDPEAAQEMEGIAAWRAARAAILRAIPVALKHAGMDSLDTYARSDGWVDRVYYLRHARRSEGMARLLWNPTGRVRAATLEILAHAPQARVDERLAAHHLGATTKKRGAPLQALEALRAVTLQ